MVMGRRKASAKAMERYTADQQLAQRLPELLERVRKVRAEFRAAEKADLDPVELRQRGQELDAALTEATRAAYAAERVAVGPRGHDDRLHRRRRLARPEVKERTLLAERLLTERETHRLHGIAGVPWEPAG